MQTKRPLSFLRPSEKVTRIKRSLIHTIVCEKLFRSRFFLSYYFPFIIRGRGDTYGQYKTNCKTAGVSISTVSRVLNNHPYVKEEKRKRVLDAVEELNYAKNINAIHLIKGKTYTIGVMLPFINLPYFSTIIEGIGNEALAAGYHINLCQTNYDSIEEIRVLEMMKMKQFDGMIICSRTSSWEQIEPFAKFAPIISCEKMNHPLISSVYVSL